MPKHFLIDHIDLRVRDWQAATTFYDAVLGALGLKRETVAGSARISFAAASRDEMPAVAEAAKRAGARDVEFADGEYGPKYHAVFFSDPDGNKLEACFVEQ